MEKICPICNKSFKTRDKRIKTCSRICGREYQKLRCIEKYGVDNPWKAEEVKNKMKEKWIEKYGVDNPSKAQEIKDKIKNILKNSEFDFSEHATNNYKKRIENNEELVGAVPAKKYKKTCLEKYGNEYFFGSDIGNMSHKNLKENYNYSSEQLLELSQKKAITLNNLIKKYGEINGTIKYKKWYKNIKNTKENFIRRHGEIEGLKKYEDYIIKITHNNKFGLASKESLVLFKPLYKFCRKLGIERKDIFLGISGSKEFYIYDNGINFFDFTIKSLKLIFEYNGETFHVNTNKVTDLENWKCPLRKISGIEQLQLENKKIEKAQNNGFDINIIWSSDNKKETLEQMKNIILNKMEKYKC